MSAFLKTLFGDASTVAVVAIVVAIELVLVDRNQAASAAFAASGRRRKRFTALAEGGLAASPTIQPHVACPGRDGIGGRCPQAASNAADWAQPRFVL